MSRQQDVRAVWASVEALPGLPERLRAALMLAPAEVPAACRLAEPGRRREGAARPVDIYTFLENSVRAVECIPQVHYCSCVAFERNGTAARRHGC